MAAMSDKAPFLYFLLKARHASLVKAQGDRTQVWHTVFMHPADFVELQRETADPTVGGMYYGQNEHGDMIMLPDPTSAQVDHGIEPGWVLLERTSPLPKNRWGMMHVRCTEHDDCRKTYALGMACLADKVRRPDFERQ